MLKEQGPQTDFSGTLKGLSRSGLFAFIPSAGLWSAYYIMSRRLRLCVHSGWAVRGIMRCLSLFCQGMFVRSRIHRGRKEQRRFFFSPKGRCGRTATVCRTNTSPPSGEKPHISIWTPLFDIHGFSLSRGDFKVVAFVTHFLQWSLKCGYHIV